jgi:hypothetical protein
MSTTILLRKLTKKSKLNFGKHRDLTVEYLIEHHYKIYLRWVYFNCSNITFVDDILDEINITQEFRFEKPNKNITLYNEFKEFIDSFRTDKTKERNAKKLDKFLLTKAVKHRKYDNIHYSKGSLIRRNHGHN